MSTLIHIQFISSFTSQQFDESLQVALKRFNPFKKRQEKYASENVVY